MLQRCRTALAATLLALAALSAGGWSAPAQAGIALNGLEHPRPGRTHRTRIERRTTMQDVRKVQDVRKILAAAMLAPASLSELSEAGFRPSRHSLSKRDPRCRAGFAPYPP